MKSNWGPVGSPQGKYEHETVDSQEPSPTCLRTSGSNRHTAVSLWVAWLNSPRATWLPSTANWNPWAGWWVKLGSGYTPAELFMYLSEINQTERVRICKAEMLFTTPVLTLSAPWLHCSGLGSSGTHTADSFIKEPLSQPRPIIT